MNSRLLNPFFVRQSEEEYERAWNNLMEQQFQLKHHGKLDLFEQDAMTAEERSWFLKRLEKEFKERQEAEKMQVSSVPRPRTPSRPNISRPSMSGRR